MSLRGLWRRLRQRGRYERELDEELAFHLDAHADALVARGVERGAARRQARIALGMVEMHKQGVRQAHGLVALDAWGGDLRRAARALLRSPVYGCSAVLILGVSMAAYLVLMAIHHAYVANPPAMAAPGALVDLRLRTAQGDTARLTREELQAVRPALDGLVRGIAYARQVNVVLQGEAPATAYGIATNAGYFDLLARKPALGRALRAEDAREFSEPVVVLGHGAWQRFTHGDPAIVGKTLALSGTVHRVVGVMPPASYGFEAFPPHFWVDAAQYESWQRDADTAEGPLRYEASLQLLPAADPGQVRARLQALLAALPARTTQDTRVADVVLLPRTSQLSANESEGLGSAMLALSALALLVLLVACANLANLMLTRALARRQELGIRTSVGASRWRLLRLLMLESLLLALGGALLALVVAGLGVDVLHRYAMGLLLQMGLEVISIDVDPSLLLHALLLAFVACLAFGLPPALSVTGGDLAQGVRRDALLFGGRLAPARLRGMLVTAQVAGSLVLLVITVCFMDVARRAERVAIGYDTQVLLDLRHERVDATLRRAVEATPGVAGTSAVARTPLYGRVRTSAAEVEQRGLRLAFHAVDERYFETLGVALVAGRGFDASEAEHGADVAVISARTAQLLWPGQSALGKHIRRVESEDEGPARDVEVIGVARDVVSGLVMFGVDTSAVYLPQAMHAQSSLLVRLAGPAEPAALARVAAACASATNVPCDPWPLSRVAGMVLVPLRVASRLGMAIGALALALAALGLYGVVRYQVQGRTREIGLRLALGATATRIQALVMRQALGQVGTGLAVGMALCLLLSFALVRRIGAADAFPLAAYTLVPLLLGAVALLASWLPARAAARVQPTQALRDT